MIITDPSMRILTVNPKFTQVTGYEKEEVIGQTPRILKSGLHQDDFYQDMWTTIDQNREWKGRIWNKRKNGELYLQWIHIMAVSDDPSLVQYYVAISSDITKEKQTEEQLLLANQVLEQTTESIMITDARKKIISVNAAFTNTTGYTEQEVIGKDPKMLSSGKHDGTFYQNMWKAIHQHGSWQGEIWNRRKNGELYAEWLSISTIKNEQNKITHYVGIFSDITHQKRNEAHLHYLAHHDILTGVYNRISFPEQAEKAIAEAQQQNFLVAFLFVDLDDFKRVNDTMGHTFGDNLLREVAHRLNNSIGQKDGVFRWGGDEFTILLTRAEDLEAISKTAQMMIDQLNTPFIVQGQEVFITPSIGISVYPHDGQDINTLIEKADTTMYEVKQRQNAYQFYHS